MMMTPPLFLLLLLFQCGSLQLPSLCQAVVVYNVLDFGAAPDGDSDSGGSLARAWLSACDSPTPAAVYVPPGEFFVSRATFRGPCRSAVKFCMDGTLVAPTEYDSLTAEGHGHWIMFEGVRGLAVHGGTLDGRGASLWACKTAASARSCPAGVTSLVLDNVEDALVSGLRSIDSKLYHIVISRSRRVTVQGVKITATATSPNTDGIHVQSSTSVTVSDAAIGTGDDCVSVGPGTADLLVERVSCGPGHGISIGSLGKKEEEEGVRNVTVRSVAFRGARNGLRIKTWGRPSRGFVKGVLFQDATMVDVHNPIIIDQNYCPHHARCPDQDSGVVVSDVAYTDIRGTSATAVAVKFDCSPITPCSGIELRNIRLTYGGNGMRGARSSCKHVTGAASGLVVPPSCL